MTGIEHRLLDVPGGRIHVAEQGSGPLVLLVHGFPECWYSWRHQLPALAEAGFRAVAMDVRGYGRSSKPTAIGAYRMLDHVADVVGVITALGADEAIVVGHDWGSPIAANSALLRPDLVRAVGAAERAVHAPRRAAPHRRLRRRGRRRGVLRHVLPGARPRGGARSSRTSGPGWRASTRRSPATPSRRPTAGACSSSRRAGAWPTASPSGAAAGAGSPRRTSTCTRASSSGPVSRARCNRYRNMDRDWEDLAAWDGAPVRQPSLFLAGARDATLGGSAARSSASATTLPGLVASHVLDGCGHWVQQERPDEVNGCWSTGWAKWPSPVCRFSGTPFVLQENHRPGGPP